MRRWAPALGLLLLAGSAWAQTPGQLQSGVNLIPWNNAPQQQIRGPMIQGLFGQVIATFNSMGTWGANGVFAPNIPPAYITPQMLAPGATGNKVQTRVVSGAGPANIVAGDYLVCLNGPTAVSLELSPPVGTTHVLKDCRADTSSGNITVSSAPGDTIDGQSSLAFGRASQAMTLSFTDLSWKVY